MANVRQLKDHGAPIFPITHVSLVKGMEGRALMDATYAWDGTGTPDVSKIPAGVVVTYNGTDYTGTLVASASTTGRFYLVPSTTVQGEWDRYMTDGTGSSYAWKAAGNTSIPSPDVVDNETTDDSTKSHSASGGKRLKDQLGELEAKVNGLEKRVFGISGNFTPNQIVFTSDDYAPGTEVKYDLSLINRNSYLYLYNSSDTYIGELGNGNNQRSTGVYTLPNNFAYAKVMYGDGIAVSGIYTKASMQGMEETVSGFEDEDKKLSSEIGKYDFSGAYTFVGGFFKMGDCFIPSGTEYYLKVNRTGEGRTIIFANDDFDNSKLFDSANGGEFDTVIHKTASYDIESIHCWQPSGNTSTVSVNIREGLAKDVADLENAPVNTAVLGDAPGTANDSVSFIDGYISTTNAVVGGTFHISPYFHYSYNYSKFAIVRTKTATRIYTSVLCNLKLSASIGVLFLDKDEKVVAKYTATLSNERIFFPANVEYILLQCYGSTQTEIDGYSATLTGVSFVGNKFYDRAVNPLQGKNVVLMGDSITQMVNTTTLKGWSDYFHNMYGANVFNIAVGGTHIESPSTLPTDPTSPDYTDTVAAYWLSIIRLTKAIIGNDLTNQDNAIDHLNINLLSERTKPNIHTLASMVSDIDVIVIFSGTNGSDYIVDKGTTDWNDYDETKPFSALNSAIKLWYEANPNLSIFVFTPIPRYYGADWNSWDNSKYSDNYIPTGFTTPPMLETVDGIMEVAKNNSIPVCNLYRELGINRHNFSSWFAGTDGTHPVNGFERIAKKIGAFIVSHANFK